MEQNCFELEQMEGYRDGSECHQADYVMCLLLMKKGSSGGSVQFLVHHHCAAQYCGIRLVY
jgi:hypothetical protein